MVADLAQLDDLTRRYARYRPCGAGLGAFWGGVLLMALTGLVFRWTVTAYGESPGAAPRTPDAYWQFLRSAPLFPPPWLVLAAAAVPFVAWFGITIIQRWVDRRFGTVRAADDRELRAVFRGPRWIAPAAVGGLAAAMAARVLFDAAHGASAVGIVGLLAIAGWAAVWGRRSRDRLTLWVMLTLSIPPLFIMASTDGASRMADATVGIFSTYVFVTFSLLGHGVRRFRGFLSVRRDLAAIQVMDE